MGAGQLRMLSSCASGLSYTGLRWLLAMVNYPGKFHRGNPGCRRGPVWPGNGPDRGRAFLSMRKRPGGEGPPRKRCRAAAWEAARFFLARAWTRRLSP